MWHIHTREYFLAFKKEGNSDTCYPIDKPWKHYAKWNKAVTKGQILYHSTHRYRKWLPGALGRGSGELMFNGHKTSFGKMKRVLRMNGSDGYTTMWK